MNCVHTLFNCVCTLIYSFCCSILIRPACWPAGWSRLLPGYGVTPIQVQAHEFNWPQPKASAFYVPPHPCRPLPQGWRPVEAPPRWIQLSHPLPSGWRGWRRRRSRLRRRGRRRRLILSCVGCPPNCQSVLVRTCRMSWDFLTKLTRGQSVAVVGPLLS